MKRVLAGVGLALVVTGCAAPAHRAAPAAAPAAVVVSPAASSHARALGLAACHAWDAVATAADLTAVTALRRTAVRDASAAAALDPHWAPLAHDLGDLGTLEAAYAKADVYHAYPLAPRLEALRKRIPTRC